MTNNNTKWLMLLLLAMFTSLGTWAQTTVNFDDGKLPEGWTKVGTATYLTVEAERAKSGQYSLNNGSTYSEGNYIVTPVVEGDVSFYARAYRTRGKASTYYIKVYPCEDNGDGTYTLGTTALYDEGITSTTYAQKKFTVSDATHLAILLSNTCLDDFTYTEGSLATGPAVALYDAAGTKVKSGATVSLGLAEAGATKTFTIKNSGTEDLTGISVTADGVTVSAPEATTLAAKASTTFTVTLPTTYGAFSGTITVNATGVDATTITVSGDVKDPDKFFCNFADGVLPDGWTNKTTGTSTYSTYYGWTFAAGYASTTEYYEALLTTPVLSFTEGETLYFDVLSAGTYSYQTPSLTVRYSADGTTFTDIKAFSSTDITSTTAYTTLSVEVPAAAKYIQFGGKYVQLTNIYGGSLPKNPILSTDAADFDLGLASTDSKYTFTIKNTGGADMTNVKVESSNAGFAVSGLTTTTIAKGESATVSVSYTGKEVGQQTTELTISADDVEAVKVNGKAYVMDNTKILETFDKAPERWTIQGWTFADGKAKASYTSYSSTKNIMTSPKIVVKEGETFAIAGFHAEDYSSLTVNGSADNGETWTAYTKKVALATTSSVVVLSDIPATVNRLQLVGSDVTLDAINGFTYSTTDPKATLYSDAEATTVATDAAADFGFTKTNDSKTFYLKNTGLGALTISSVTAPEGITATLADDAKTLAEGAQAALTITLASGVANGNVVVTTDGGTVTIPVSGVFVDASKNYVDFTTEDIPSTWENTGWTKKADGYIDSYSYSSTYDLKTSVLDVAEGEKLVLAVKRYSTSSWYAPSLQIFWKAAADEKWKAENVVTVDFTGIDATNFSVVSLAGIPAGSWQLCFRGQNADIQRIYGFTKPANDPHLAVTGATDNAIAFGLSTTAVEKTITVKNDGTGTLKATIAVSEGADFTVTPATVELTADEEATVTVTMGTTVGKKSGTLTIAPEGLDAVTIALSGTTVAEGTWMVDFEDGSTKGWMLQNASVKEPDADYGRTSYVLNISSSYYDASYAITPKLTVAEGDALYFDAWQQYSGASLKVSYSTDRENWTEAKSYTLTATATTQTLTGIPAGDVYLKFEGKYAYIDNIAGFKLADVKHDVTFSSVTIPTTGTSGTALTVSVGAKELLGQDETLTATLKIGDETLTAEAQTAKASATTYLSFEFTPKAVVENAEATLTLAYADGTTVEAGTQTMTISAGSLTWTDGYEMDMPEGTFDINYSRKLSAAGWNTLCLPFTVSEADMAQFGTGVKLFEVTGYSDGTITVSPSADKTLQASKPYIVYTGADTPTSLSFSNVALKAATPTDVTLADGEATISFKGTFAARQDLDASNYVMTNDGHIEQCAATGAYAYAGRAVFTLNAAAQAKGVRIDIVGVTGIKGLSDIKGETNDKVYNLNGQRLSRPRHGINIVNGKKVMVR